MLTLIVLRFGVGWHFYQEGIAKLKGTEFSSATMLGGAVGPLSSFFHSFVWDADGRARLDEETTRQMWAEYAERVREFYGFDDAQGKQAQAAVAARERQLAGFFEENREDLQSYFRELERWERAEQDPSRTEVPSLEKQNQKLAAELGGQRGPWLKELDGLWAGLQQDLADLATPEQAERGRLAIDQPGRRRLDTETIDRIIPYFITTVGVLLMLGLFTRVASLAGAGFLIAVVGSQWPGTPGAMPTYYQSVECLSLLVLAAVGAGRFGGLDFLVQKFFRWCCPPRGRVNDEPHA